VPAPPQAHVPSGLTYPGRQSVDDCCLAQSINDRSGFQRREPEQDAVNCGQGAARKRVAKPTGTAKPPLREFASLMPRERLFPRRVQKGGGRGVFLDMELQPLLRCSPPHSSNILSSWIDWRRQAPGAGSPCGPSHRICPSGIPKKSPRARCASKHGCIITSDPACSPNRCDRQGPTASARTRPPPCPSSTRTTDNELTIVLQEQPSIPSARPWTLPRPPPDLVEFLFWPTRPQRYTLKTANLRW